MTVLMVPELDAKRWPTLGPLVCDWIERNLVFGPGDKRGEQAAIDDEKRALIYRMYEVHPQNAGDKAGRRRFRKVALSLRKGSAKTELMAWIAACELHPRAPVRCVGWTKGGEPIGGAVRDPYIPLVAYTEEQSDELAFGALRVILSLSKVAKDFDIGLERILRADGSGKAVSLASSPGARDGARTTFQGFDEPLALDTPVPTPAGWRSIGELGEGDYVFDRHGRAVAVVGCSPVQIGRPCYRVTFRGGESVVTDAAHRWKVTDWSNRPRGEQVVTTQEMFDRGTETKYGLRWRLPRGAGIEGRRQDLPIDPYLLGLWLGDGATSAGYVHSAVPDYLEMCVGFDHAVSQDARQSVVRWLPKGLRSSLRHAGLLGSKHVPQAYMFADQEQRRELLRGLMDTDGHTTRRGACTFVQKSEAFAGQVAELVRSLGVPASLCRQADARSRTGEMWKVHFSPDFCPFRLARKAGRHEWGKRDSTWWPAVESIEPVPSVPVKCIAVDSDDHLFVFGRGFHLTHNTHRFVLAGLKKAHRVMIANLPKRKLADPWALETTTAFAPGEQSVAEDTMAYARAVAEGRKSDAKLFFFHRFADDSIAIYQPDGTVNRAGLNEAILDASGGLAAWTDLDGVAEQWNDPTADRADLERLWLNRIKHSTARAFDVLKWNEALLKSEHVVPDGALITLGFDGSRYNDSTALIATEVETGFQWALGIWEKPFVDLDAHVKQHWEVPEAEVDEAVHAAFSRYSVWKLYGDPPNWETHMSKWSGEFGEDRVYRFRTNLWKKMAFACKSYRTAMQTGDVSHGPNGNDELARSLSAAFGRHIGNAHRMELRTLDEDRNKEWVIVKERKDSPNKMDAAVASVLSWQARNDALSVGAEPPEKEVNESWAAEWA